MVSETQFPSLESQGDSVHLSKSLEVVPESEPVRSSISELKNHTYVYESTFPDCGYDAWVVNGEVLMDELPPPIVRKEKTKEEQIQYLEILGMFYPSALSSIKSGFPRACCAAASFHMRKIVLTSTWNISATSFFAPY
ncbi:hypothetical protein OROHE_010916 [Orobanche hederae]